MRRSKIENGSESVYAFLYKDRTPFAKAELIGTDKTEGVSGCVEFFTTPLGVLIHAKLCGLPERRKSGVYNFCVRASAGNECIYSSIGDKRSLCTVMPVAYERGGCADSSSVTRRIAPSDLVSKRIVVYERRLGCPKDELCAIATGNIACC